jgi:hypothetical protein
MPTPTKPQVDEALAHINNLDVLRKHATGLSGAQHDAFVHSLNTMTRYVHYTATPNPTPAPEVPPAGGKKKA